MKKLFFLIAVCMLFSSLAYSQPIQTDQVEFQVDTDKQIISEQKTVGDMIDDYLNSKGWNEGENIKSNGSKFYIGRGTGAIQPPLSHPAYLQARINAFEKAFLDSKLNLVESLGTAISSETTKSYQEGSFDETKKPEKTKAEKDRDSIIDKLRKLTNAKLDKMLRAEGVEPEKASAKQVEKALVKIASTEQFRKFTQTVAQTRISGAQVLKCFEGPGEGKGYEIGVLLVSSDTLREMASAIYTGEKPQAKAPKAPIIKQIPADTAVLMGTFGVQQKIDQNGDLVLVVYAQAAPKTSSSNSIAMAYRKAKTSGMGYLRQFAGENYKTTNDALNAETTNEYEDETKEYENQSAYKEMITSVSKSLTISGQQQIKKWDTKHPLTGKKIVGVVLAWSPKSSVQAKQLRNEMNKIPAQQSDSTETQPVYQGKQQLDHEGMTSSGAEADDDAF